MEDVEVNNILDDEDAIMNEAKVVRTPPTRMFFTESDIDELLSQPCAEDPSDFS